ncbi:MAG: Gfo/Idh/MocA family oxidoreductase [Chloroflexi bacterium]|nr:Gfo/Idh/MocA family oxidoreductase [Chloroflexota bacterium]
MQRVRVAVVGAGAMANQVHYPSLASMDDVDLVAICDLDAQRLQTTADRWGVARRYSDYQQMVEQVAPDAIYVIGPPHLMYDIWAWCLEQRLDLFIEKPLGITEHQARSLAYLAAQHGCVTQVGFQRRSSPLAARLHDICLARGPITLAACEFFKCSLAPFLGARDHMMDDTVHAIDTLRWACGGEVAAVHSTCRRVGVPDINLISAELQFENGSLGLLTNSWSSGRRVFRMQMHAPGICAELEHETGGVVYADGDVQGRHYDAREVAGSQALHIYGGFAAKSREFIDAVKNRTQPSSCFADAYKTMQIAETILAQAILAGA